MFEPVEAKTKLIGIRFTPEEVKYIENESGLKISAAAIRKILENYLLLRESKITVSDLD